MRNLLREKYGIEIHDELNPRIWNREGNLLPKIREGILSIVDEFQDYIEYDLPIVDVVIVGSNASYNYTNNSDLDIHIIVNFSNIDDNTELVSMLCQNWKTLFNKAYDISLGGQSTEIYIEDMQTSTNSNGIYSVLNDKWLKFPEKLSVYQDFDIEDDLAQVKLEIENALNSDDLDEVTKMIDWLYYQRKLALQINGEFSLGNLIFKAVRNEGLLDKLKEKQLELKSKELTVESLDEWWTRKNLKTHAKKHRNEYENDTRFHNSKDQYEFRDEYEDISLKF